MRCWPTSSFGITRSRKSRVNNGPFQNSSTSFYNQDAVVDAADYVVWRKGLGNIYTQDDYNVWRFHFGQSAGNGSGASANAAVPEPATSIALIVAAAGMSTRRRWRTRQE